MNNTYKKIVVTPVFHILSVFAFIGTMFVENTYYTYTTYKNQYYSYYYYYYSYKVPSYHTSYNNFFESVFTDVLPGIFGILVFIMTLALLIISIVSLSGKKASVINIIECVIPFVIAIDYGAYMIAIETTSSYSLDEGAAIMFIPLGVMAIFSIIGIVFTVKNFKQNKEIDGNVQYGMGQFESSSVGGYGMQTNIQTPEAAAPEKKFCTYCGNECVWQAVVCPKCGNSF